MKKKSGAGSSADSTTTKEGSLQDAEGKELEG